VQLSLVLNATASHRTSLNAIASQLVDLQRKLAQCIVVIFIDDVWAKVLCLMSVVLIILCANLLARPYVKFIYDIQELCISTSELWVLIFSLLILYREQVNTRYSLEIRLFGVPATKQFDSNEMLESAIASLILAMLVVALGIFAFDTRMFVRDRRKQQWNPARLGLQGCRAGAVAE
jgi:hypothetical protein